MEEDFSRIPQQLVRWFVHMHPFRQTIMGCSWGLHLEKQTSHSPFFLPILNSMPHPLPSGFDYDMQAGLGLWSPPASDILSTSVCRFSSIKNFLFSGVGRCLCECLLKNEDLILELFDTCTKTKLDVATRTYKLQLRKHLYFWTCNIMTPSVA